MLTPFQKGWTNKQQAEAVHKVMQALGYEQYGTYPFPYSTPHIHLTAQHQ